MLSPRQDELWSDYLIAERRQPRNRKIDLLATFLESLNQSAIEEWESWARDLARRVVDEHDDFIIRLPLFRTAVFPALLRGIHNNVSGCARWLAGLAQQLHSCPDCLAQLPPYQRTEVGLLRYAVRGDPTDERSRQRLIDLFSIDLSYSLHELPGGILYEADGATADQCVELQADLEEFIELVGHERLSERYATLIDECQFHFCEYRNYLLRSEEFDNYSDYLKLL